MASLTIVYREAWKRDEQRVAWIGSAAERHTECKRVIAEYDGHLNEEQ